MKQFLLLILLLVLGGCEHLPNVPTETNIPIGIPCLTKDQIPVRPDFVTDAQLAIRPDAQLIFSLAGDRLLRQGYEKEIEARLAGCADNQKGIPTEIVTPKETTNTDKPWWKFW